ncbi:MAG: hypothetical protein B6I36_10415 [Desulfobacteraceae bacterium 4572_35.1]|nr:MAG: hypothetical protein B6I36_10415 [Desulfobacteraceae bacterium 4572_35.1]
MLLSPIYHLLFQMAATLYLASTICYLCGKQRWAGWGVTLGLFVHTLSQIGRCWRYDFFTLEGVFHAGHFLPWCLAALIVLCWHRHQTHMLSVLLPLSAVMVLVIAFPPECHQPKPFTPTWSAHLFFIFENLAHACFIVSGWLALQFLRGRMAGQQFHTYAVWGFVCYSIAQLSGCVWTYLGWGGLFHWGTRHIHSAAVWCCYCSYLHTSFLTGFYPRKKAYFAVVSSVLVLILFYGLPLVPKSGTNKMTRHQQLMEQQPTAQHAVTYKQQEGS